MNKLTPATEQMLILPEHREIVEAFISEGEMDVRKTAEYLSLPLEEVTSTISLKSVQKFLDTIWFNSGMRTPDKILGKMEEIIEQKLEEMMETEMGSDKDIFEILEKYNKAVLEWVKIRSKAQEVVSNVGKAQQNNFYMGGDPSTGLGALEGFLNGKD